MKRTVIQIAALTTICGFTLGAIAQNASTNAPARLGDMVVTGEAEYDETVQGPFLPPVQGTKINSGKKTSVLDLDELPKVQNNNYRQALTKTPGLLLSEETSPLVSVGYRGLNPHRAQFTQVLKDGLPIHADQFGYPEAYYTPPLDTVDRIEFLRGGASLMYGPQPGGALNYVTHRPRTDKPFSARTQHIFGTDNLYSTFNSIDGTVGRVGYYAYFNHRQTDGFRTANSDVALYAGSVKLVLDADKDSRWILGIDGYDEEHGEPGGLTVDGFRTNRNFATRQFDRFRLERYVASLGWEKDLSDDTLLTVTAWGGYYSRFSRRQSGGGFGGVPTAPTNNVELQEFWTKGIEGRLRHDWYWGENVNTFAAGTMFYHTDSPRLDMFGPTVTSDRGPVNRDTDRDVFYAPLFIENRFVFGNLSITPGLRLENVWQNVRENVNTSKAAQGTPLGDSSDYAFVPLPGLGIEYEFSPGVQAYGNVSKSYRPKIFTEAVPTGGGNVVNEDLEEGSAWQYEIGVRGQPRPYLTWDTSLFWLEFDNQVGTLGNTVANIGRTVHHGWEAAVDVEMIGLIDAMSGGSDAVRDHQFSLYGNVMLLDAEIRTGANAKKAPQYAPDYVVRGGGIYRWRDRAKVALLGTWVADHWADDAHTDGRFIPSYMVWDLTLECRVFRDNVSVLAGINNLFDENYFARVRGDGIDPAYRRNFYAGFALSF